MATEIERKFAATDAQQEQIRSDHPGSWETIAMQTTYYDTPDAALSQRRWTLRLRLENGTPICTFKTPEADGIRGEWDCQCDTIEKAVAELCKLDCPKELASLARQGLIPICGARFTRQALTLAAEGCTLELALDSGVLMGGSREEALCEIEAELKSGSEEALDAFASRLASRYGLKTQSKSKFRRALALAKGE